MNTTFDVRVWGIKAYKGKRKSTYTVRWMVAEHLFQNTFATKALAESERSKLLIAQRSGTAFDTTSGLPEPEARKKNSRTWLQHSMAFVDMKWPRSSANHRRNTAEALTTITLLFLSSDRGVPAADDLRKALYNWAFNTSARRPDRLGKVPDLPPEFTRAMKWLEGNTLPVPQLDDAALMRKALDGLSLRLNGQPAAASTVARKRTALSSALKYAVELGLIESNPLSRVTWIAPKSNEEVDRRTVVNPSQARSLISAAGKIMPDLEAFFGCMYYAAMRPEEVKHLKVVEFERPTVDGGWGWFNLTGATVEVGDEWGDHEGANEQRGLKHRAKSATRRVPVPPALVELLVNHHEKFAPGPEGEIFISRRGPGGRFLSTAGHPVSTNTYGRVWRDARIAVLSGAQQASPLAKAPYHLRHAAVSLWLNAGVPATQVAEWAGHSVNVLLRTYAKCIDGQEDAARLRVQAVLALEADVPEPVAADPADPQVVSPESSADGDDKTSPRIRRDE